MKNNSFSIFISRLLLFVLGSVQANAQLVNCNIFLQGDYLEVGLGPNGSFGTTVVAPSGYHADVSDTMYSCTSSMTIGTELGFVADPNEDGWTVGVPPYFGDYILPGGRPREGWAMSDMSGSATAYSSYYASSTDGFTGTLSGSNVSYSTTLATTTGVWEGIFGADSISVTQRTTIANAGLFLDMHISFANLHDTATDTFYYLRTVNPHNEATLTLNLETKNKIEYQLPNVNNLTVVSAVGTFYTNAYMELGTNDTRAVGFLIKDSTMPDATSLAAIWAGDTANYQYSDSLTGNLGMGLVFRIVLGAGDSTTLDFGYSFKGGVLDSILTVDTTGTGTGTLQTKNLTPSARISVYPNPTNDIINITGLQAGESIGLTDVLGRAIPQNIGYNGQQTYSFSVGNLPSGVYLMTVKSNDGTLLSVTRVAKQ